MVGNIFILVPYIIDGTTLHLCCLVSYYHSITLSQPSCNLTKALCTTSPIIKNFKRSLNYTLYILKSYDKALCRTLAVNIFTVITISGTLSQFSL